MSRTFLLLLAALVVAGAARATPPDLTVPALDASEAAWSSFGQNLVAALQSDNHGLQCSALQHVVTYGDRLDVRAARFEVIRLYRDHRDMRVRMLALSALAQMRDPWVADFLQRSARAEQDEHLARLTAHAAEAATESVR